MKTSRKRKKTAIILSITLALLLAACQPTPTATSASTATPAPTATPSQMEAARQRLDAYYTALIGRDYAQAAALFTTRVGVAQSELIQMWQENDRQGWRLTGYEIVNQREYDETRIVFWVRVSQEGGEPPQFDTINVVHLEGDGWFVGNATLDKIALQDRPYTQEGVRVIVGVFFRYVEGYALWLNIRNDGSEVLTWGKEGETCGTLAFADRALDSPCAAVTQIRPGKETDVSLVFLEDVLSRPRDERPAAIEIASFSWDRDGDGLPDPDRQPWSFQFELRYETP